MKEQTYKIGQLYKYIDRNIIYGTKYGDILLLIRLHYDNSEVYQFKNLSNYNSKYSLVWLYKKRLSLISIFIDSMYVNPYNIDINKLIN